MISIMFWFIVSINTTGGFRGYVSLCCRFAITSNLFSLPLISGTIAPSHLTAVKRPRMQLGKVLQDNGPFLNDEKLLYLALHLFPILKPWACVLGLRGCDARGRWTVRRERVRPGLERRVLVKLLGWFYQTIFIVKYALSGSIDRWSKVKQSTVPENPTQGQLDPLRGCAKNVSHY